MEPTSRLVVTRADPGGIVEWQNYDFQADPGVRVAFGRPATSLDPEAPFNLGKVASGEVEQGQFLGLCGPPTAVIGLNKIQWIGAWSGPTVNLTACT